MVLLLQMHGWREHVLLTNTKILFSFREINHRSPVKHGPDEYNNTMGIINHIELRYRTAFLGGAMRSLLLLYSVSALTFVQQSDYE
jgi:hypothetical protein